MESAERLTPVAVKESATQQAFALISAGYVQAAHLLECPRCPARFFLLLDPRDRIQKRKSEVEQRAIDYFCIMIAAQHLTGHQLNCLEMPDSIRQN